VRSLPAREGIVDEIEETIRRSSRPRWSMPRARSSPRRPRPPRSSASIGRGPPR